MIKRLFIHRFRGIKEGILDDLGQINLLIGPNNSGKTAILEMLYLGSLAHRSCSFVNSYLEPSAWPAKTLDIYDFLGLEALKRIRQRHGEPEDWKECPADVTADGSLAITLPNVPDNYPLREFELAAPLDSPGRRRTFSKKDIQRISLFQLEPWEGYEVPSDLIPPIFQKHDVRLENGFWSYLWEDTWVYRWKRSEGIDYFAVWAMEGVRPTYVAFFDFHTAEQHFTQQFAQWAKNQPWNWMEKIKAHLVKVFPALESMNVEIDDAPGGQQGETGYLRGLEGRLLIDHFGDGARHAFKVLASLIALSETVDEEHHGLFLWEDPELFMHPTSLNRLLQEILKLTKDKSIQVFISSQSIETTALLTAHIRKMEMQSGYRVLRLDLQDGKLFVAKYNYDNVMAWFKAGMDLRFWEAIDLPISYCYLNPEEE